VEWPAPPSPKRPGGPPPPNPHKRRGAGGGRECKGEGNPRVPFHPFFPPTPPSHIASEGMGRDGSGVRGSLKSRRRGRGHFPLRDSRPGSRGRSRGEAIHRPGHFTRCITRKDELPVESHALRADGSATSRYSHSMAGAALAGTGAVLATPLGGRGGHGGYCPTSNPGEHAQLPEMRDDENAHVQIISPDSTTPATMWSPSSDRTRNLPETSSSRTQPPSPDAAAIEKHRVGVYLGIIKGPSATLTGTGGRNTRGEVRRDRQRSRRGTPATSTPSSTCSCPEPASPSTPR